MVLTEADVREIVRYNWDGNIWRIEPGMGATPGLPDLYIVRKGFTAWVELKRSPGSPVRAAQVRFRNVIRGNAYWATVSYLQKDLLCVEGPGGKSLAVNYRNENFSEELERGIKDAQ